MTTNYERIKAMTLEEMIYFIKCCFCTDTTDKFLLCKSCFIEKLCEVMNQDYMKTEINDEIIKQWLEQEREEE